MKRIVAVVLLGSTLGIVFFVFWVSLSASDDDVSEDVPSWWRGNAYTGLIVEITDDHLTLHTHEGDNLPFKLDANTRFIVRGNTPARPGVEVKVNFRNIHGPDSSFMLARTVRVLKTEVESSPTVNPSGLPRGAPSGAAASGRPSGVPSGRSATVPTVSAGVAPHGVPSGVAGTKPSGAPLAHPTAQTAH